MYAGNRDGVQQLFLRSRDQLDAIPIRDTEDAVFPFFSPDGEWVGFFAGDALKKVSPDACAEEGRYDFMFMGLPLKVARGTGSPANPIAMF